MSASCQACDAIRLGPGRRDLDQAGANIPIGQVVHRPDRLPVVDHAEHGAVLLATVVDDLPGELVERAVQQGAAITVGQLPSAQGRSQGANGSRLPGREGTSFSRGSGSSTVSSRTTSVPNGSVTQATSPGSSIGQRTGSQSRDRET